MYPKKLAVLLGASVSLVLLTAFSASASDCESWFKSNAPRWQEPQDTDMAINEPDCYAWRLFIALNWPADEARKVADRNQNIGSIDGKRAVWETWRNARNNAPDTAFPINGSDPGPWIDSSAGNDTDERFKRGDSLPLQQLVRAFETAVVEPSTEGEEIDPVAALQQVNETRLNKETYEFIHANELYNLDGQIALFRAGEKSIVFPKMAKEVKAQWRRIEAADRDRFHWAEVDTPAGVQYFGLTALHITTKDIPNWFWATFEHVDNERSESEGGWPGAHGWETQSIDRFSCPESPIECDEAPAILNGTKWRYYRLRGTQVDFINPRGKPIILANSQPERGFQQTSSCMTCHANATIGERRNRRGQLEARRLPVFLQNGDGPVGVPDLKNFENHAGEMQFTQLDFVWSLFRACRKDEFATSCRRR